MTTATVTTTTTSSSGTVPSGVDTSETLTAGHGDAEANAAVLALGSYPVHSAVHDGANEPTLDTEQGLVSAVGGQDVHALAFVGAEIQPIVSPGGASMMLAETSQASFSSPFTNWVTHPSAIGYRRTGLISSSSGGSSGGGSSHTVIPGVSPEFDSGMNDGADGQELERVENFYSGAEENPTSAQSAQTPRAEQQTNGMGAPGGGPSMGGIVGPSGGNEPTWTPAFNPSSGHGHYNPFAGWSFASQGRSPGPTQDSLPAAGPALPDGIGYPQGFNERFHILR